MKVLSRVIWGFRRENRKINGQYITISPPPFSRFKIPTEPLLPLIKTLFCLPLKSPMTPGLILLSSKLGDVAKLQSFSSKDSGQNIQISDLFSLFCSFDIAVSSVTLFFSNDGFFNFYMIIINHCVVKLGQKKLYMSLFC